jgi:hypothetical protein
VSVRRPWTTNRACGARVGRLPSPALALAIAILADVARGVGRDGIRHAFRPYLMLVRASIITVLDFTSTWVT